MKVVDQAFNQYLPTLEAELKEPIFISGLPHGYRIFQRKKGHRHSIDDALTAWYALEKANQVNSVLDLGSGIGSVGLGVLAGLGQDASLVCIEAQEISYRLLKANIECNQLSSRVNAIFGDLRELKLDRKFRLVTGSPPYFQPGAGTLPIDSQKAYARFELRGDVSDYARVAKEHLEDDGVFVFCFPYQQMARCIELVEKSGLKVTALKHIIPRRTKPALFSVYAAKHHRTGGMIEESSLIVADESGSYSEEMLAIQRSRGFGPEGSNKHDSTTDS